MITAAYGIPAIVKAAHILKLAATEATLNHTLGVETQQLDALDVCRAATYASMRAKWIQGVGRVETIPVPALVCLRGVWQVVERIEGSYWYLYDPSTQQHNREPLPTKQQWANTLVVLLAENKLTVSEVKFGFQWFLPSILRHKRQLRDVLALSFMLQLVALFSPMVFQNVIDMVLVHRGLSSLHVLALAMLGFAVAEPLYSYLRGKVFSHFSSKVNSELSSRLYRHLITLPLDYFAQRQTGQVVARIREMAHIRQFLTGSALMLILDSVFIVMFLIVMFHYAKKLAWIVIASLFLYAGFWLIMGPILRFRVTKEYDANALSTAFLTESITGIETIKTTGTESDFLRKWQVTLACQIRSAFTANKVGIFAGQGVNLIQKLSSAAILYVGVKLVIAGNPQTGEFLTPGGLVAFNMLSSHVTQPILRLAQMWQEFQHTLIALRRIGDILDSPSEVGRKGVAMLPQLQGKVEFNNVRFRYNAESPEVLQGLTFSVQAGEFIGITGPSGSGKSTLTRLLQRLYVPQQGQVLVDGMDLAIADPSSLRCNMSVVLQENVLFAGSIIDNIRLCSPEAPEEEVIASACLAGADEFIAALPHGYHTMIGERGNGLSGGQRQRVALARALLANPRILILDEATSALDYESESAIMANMDKICADRTVISIAHRLNTIRRTNRILVVDQGQIVEQGNHERLLEKKGLYAHLWDQQTG
ncbi:MAG: type I secretion system permease/ATPase [Candidatus Symbiodolus clandestinus]